MPMRRGTIPAVAVAVATLAVSLVLTGCSATGTEGSGTVSTRFADGVLAAEPDSGGSADQDAVRRAVRAALTDEGRAFTIDRVLRGGSPADVLSTVTGRAQTRARAALLGRARSTALARELQTSFTSYASEEFGDPWSGTGSRAAWLDRDVRADSAFHVDRWQGVQVGEDVARVLVRGEDCGTTWGGARRCSAWAQVELVLRRDPTAPQGWRVIQQQAASTAA